MIDPRVPPAVAPLLEELISRLDRELPGLVNGFYLYGSIAYGTWQEGASDVDAVATLTRRCLPAEVAILSALHEELSARFPQPPLEISYLPLAECGPHARPGTHVVFRQGTFHPAGADELDSSRWSAILWWQLKRRGIALRGPAMAELPFTVTVEELLEDNRRLMRGYWSAWGRSPTLLLKLRHDAAVEWLVLGMLRTWYTLREGDVTGKAAAGKYALARLPPRWHPLIRATLDERGRNQPRGLIARGRRALAAASFARFIVADSASARRLPT
jgi:hypothetical protein